MKRPDRTAVAALRDELALLEVQMLDAARGRSGALGRLKARHRDLLATLCDVQRAEDRRLRALVASLIVAGAPRPRLAVRRLEIPLP